MALTLNGQEVSVGAVIVDDLLPFADDTYDIGSSTKAYADGHFDGTIYTDAIGEHSSGQGVTIDGLLLKDSKLLGTLTVPSVTDTLVGKATTDIFTNKTLTAPDINGGTADSLTSLSVRSTGAAYDLLIASTAVYTASRTLTINIPTTANAALTLTGDLIRSGAHSLTLTTSATTDVTLPTTGTLATLAGNEALTTKTYNGLTISTGTNTFTLTRGSATLVRSGAHACTLTTTAATGVTLPTTGTLATLAGTEELDNKTLDTSVAKGTWTASGTWTIPAVTLGGALDANSQTIGTTGHITLGDAAYLQWSDVILRRATTNTLQTEDHFNIAAGFNLSINQGYISLLEMTAPGAGAANIARIYADVNGVLTTVNAVFQDGTVDTFATEATPLDAPTFRYKSNTEAKIVMRKPHPGLIQLLLEFPDGSKFPLKEIQYHNAEKIAANEGCEGPLPKKWAVETTEEMHARFARIEAEGLAIEGRGS